MLHRRRFALAGLASPWLAGAAAAAGTALQFPRDHGAHPAARQEHWQLSGMLRATAGGREFGFSIGFRRAQVQSVISAQAALADVQGQRLWYQPAPVRAPLPATAPGELVLRVGDWALRHRPRGLQARVSGSDFGLDLQLDNTQPLLLQGRDGRARTGPREQDATHWVSLPQLAARGSLTLGQEKFAVSGQAWLDHDWSDAPPHPELRGTDRVVANLLDGATLSIVQWRGKGGDKLWAGGSYRASPRSSIGATLFPFQAAAVQWRAERQWLSPASGVRYPLEWVILTPADFYTLRPRFDAQEIVERIDGALQPRWEGLVDVFAGNGERVGSGWLVMDGYRSGIVS